MPEFHDTQMGRKFYDYQLPALIKAIQENTAALKELAKKEEPTNNRQTIERGEWHA